VSSYDKLYNWIWFFNGYHAEHHFRPKVHWTRMQALRDQIVEQQRAAGVRVIKPPHALGFLDRDLPRLNQNRRQSSHVRWDVKSARFRGGANPECAG
jgi:fatty acid desaturase